MDTEKSCDIDPEDVNLEWSDSVYFAIKMAKDLEDSLLGNKNNTEEHEWD